MADSIFDFDPVAANNTSYAGIPYGPNQLYHNQIDNLFRAYGAALGGFVDDLGAVATPTGSATAVAVTLSQGFTAYGSTAGTIRHGTLIALKMPWAATAAATLNVNTIGTKKIRRQGDSAIQADDWLANGIYFFRYDTAYDTAAGAWVLMNAASSNVGAASTSAAGIVELATRAEALANTDTSRAVTPDGLFLPTGFLYGLTLSNNVSDATNDIDIAPGKARDSTDTENIYLAAGITKRLDAAWAVGSGNGGLDQGSIANATYHKHLIKRVDTGVVDAIFSLSHDKPATVTMTIASPGVVTWGVAGAGHGLVAGSPFKFSTTGALPTGVTAGTQYYVISTGLTETTFQFAATNGGAAINTTGSQSGVHTGLPGPQLPTNYTIFRRIGSIVRASAAIVTFKQIGDEFLRLASILDVNAANPGTSAVTRTLSVPIGVNVWAIINAQCTNAAAGVSAVLLLSEMERTDEAASFTAAPLGNVGRSANVSGSSAINNSRMVIRTNTSGQIRSRVDASDANVTVLIATTGWIDRRGREG